MIIAEAGVNHNGDMNLAKKLIDVAAESGADYVKFQTFSANRLVTKNVHKADYQKQDDSESESQYSMLRVLELSPESHQELFKYSEFRKIKIFSTGFDIGSIDMLANLGQDVFKVPSGEITNLPLLRHIGQLGKRTILSTGMSTMKEIESAVEVLLEAGTEKSQLTLLQCTTAYPLPMADVNLNAMISIKDAFDIEVGYSDHTIGTEASIAAVALGATVIEKHFTLSRNLLGPDHKASLEPPELLSMIKAIRNIELALGDGVKRVMQSESKNREIARQSIVAGLDIPKGDVFTSQNLTTKRAGLGLSPMKWDEIMGSKAKRDYLADDLID
jgi:N,N'-diacetyllegionaminate synthase